MNLIQRLAMRVLNKKRYTWERQYSVGFWNFLRSDLEHERFDAVVRRLKEFNRPGKILEVGCGEALLLKRLDPSSYTFFMGIDISEVAISRAIDSKFEKSEFEYVDMEKFSTNKKFDYIIFNESIMYAINAVELMRKYMNFLDDGGYMMTSIYETNKNILVVHALRKAFTPIDSRQTTNERGTWHLDTYRKE